ncbi:hypothetical protein COX93_00795 [Candidatus Nomurabacteria bacterium CG_4_10_14_0_2_um_filter_30_12]|uniref:DUF5673 domain-containing protein n=2 Tax=Candidatus Nomuraibacteriota TaxID=1752729 RepID=A0A2J0MGB6_9BACT|nr:MAG: hypothetical protein COU48_00400 [Candidatus Nomurabacteria bacterium CG10_big_fil_rev_8_21_14_0_10_03_31_7]PIZ87517.1 MAG: hypothetical protein COX93_00795 [Candidatus Nomurabacteria bacterium CG_4_10_14_0_2_um_filter_30_12]
MDPNKKLEWTALEYEEKERGNDWFWTLGVIIVASSITSFIYNNYFFGLFLIISGILLGSFAIKKPDLVFYELNEKGLKIRNRLYTYENIHSFWVQKGVKLKPTLFIKSERQFMPIISMPIKQYNAEEVRNFMLKNGVPEEEMKEHISEKIMESLGF